MKKKLSCFVSSLIVSLELLFPVKMAAVSTSTQSKCSFVAPSSKQPSILSKLRSLLPQTNEQVQRMITVIGFVLVIAVVLYYLNKKRKEDQNE